MTEYNEHESSLCESIKDRCQVLELEELIINPKSVFARTYDFLGEDFSEKGKNFELFRTLFLHI